MSRRRDRLHHAVDRGELFADDARGSLLLAGGQEEQFACAAPSVAREGRAEHRHGRAVPRQDLPLGAVLVLRSCIRDQDEQKPPNVQSVGS